MPSVNLDLHFQNIYTLYLENRKFLDQNRIQGLCCFVPTLRILTSTPLKRTPFIPFSLKGGFWLTLIQDQLVAEMLVKVTTGLLFLQPNGPVGIPAGLVILLK